MTGISQLTTVTQFDSK